MAEWKSVEVSTEPLLEKVQPPIDSLTAVLDFLITILSIAQQILNVLKAFLVGLLDPIRSLVEQIIQEIRDLIHDLRQLGLYMSGDWDLIKSEDRYIYLVGGYQAYERRMIGRLLDNTDPGRPDFTSSSTVVALFLYVSSGDLDTVIRLIRAIVKFFRREDLLSSSMPYGTPNTPTIKYGTDGAGVAAFRQIGSLSVTPTALTVSWSMPAPLGGKGFSPAPKGFLIHVSTIPDGLQVISATPKAETSSDVEDLARVLSGAVDPLTNGPLKLYGGITDLNTTVPDFSDLALPDPRAPLLFLQAGANTPLIQPATLIHEGAPLLATTFFAKAGFVSKLGAGATFSATISKSDLPLHATFVAGSEGFAEVDGSPFEAQTYWIRIRAVTKDYIDELLPGVSGTLQNPSPVYPSGAAPYYFTANSIVQASGGILLPEQASKFSSEVGYTCMTQASGPVVAEFPSENQVRYTQAVQAAIALAVLCRADLSEAPDSGFRESTYLPGQGLKGLENAARDILARYGFQPRWFKGRRPGAFRRKLKAVLLRVSSDLLNRALPPEGVADAIVSGAKDLLGFVWKDAHDDFPEQTILESLGLGATSSSEDSGVGGNPFCRTINKRNLRGQYQEGQGPPRAPAFSESPKVEVLDTTGTVVWVSGGGSADDSPVLFNDSTGEVQFIRNAVSQYDGGSLLDAAVAVLQLAGAWVSRPVADTQWVTIRLLPQALTPLDDLLERLDRFLQAVLDGLEGITDKIVAYIEAIQARIYQLQALLVKIRALLNSLELLRFGPASGLVLAESGTAGIVQALVAAEEKPEDSATAYGAGVVLVAGGLPTLLLDLLKKIFDGGSD